MWRCHRWKRQALGFSDRKPLVSIARYSFIRQHFFLFLFFFIAAIQDESFSLDFGLAVSGVVGYANSGPHSNGSQFFITLGPCDWMNQKFVGFGRVIQGFSALRLLSSLKTSNQVPDKNIFISACGIAPVEEN